MTNRWTTLSESEIAAKSAANRGLFAKPKNTAKTRQKPPTEHAEQCKVIQWWDAFAPSYGLDKRILFAVPNGSHKSMHQAAKFKAEGLRPGVPDLFLAKGNSNYLGLFVELKRIKGSVVSKEQLDMLNLLERAGYRTELCHGHNEAINAIKDYLG